MRSPTPGPLTRMLVGYQRIPADYTLYSRLAFVTVETAWGLSYEHGAVVVPAALAGRDQGDLR